VTRRLNTGKFVNNRRNTWRNTTFQTRIAKKWWRVNTQIGYKSTSARGFYEKRQHVWEMEQNARHLAEWY